MFLANCEKDAEVQPKDYPFVITQTPSVDSGGVVFSADLKNTGNQTIIKHGFVWSTESNPTIHDFSKLFDGRAGMGIYSCNVNSGLAKDQTYYVRAYVRTGQYEVYGNVQSFDSKGSLPPEIFSFTPQKGFAGESVIIEGANFSGNKSIVTVKFGEKIATIDSITDEKIYVKSPLITENVKVKISIRVAGMETSSIDDYKVLFSWVKKENYPGLGNHSAAYFSINNYGYMIGGQEYDSDVNTSGQFCNTLWRYNADENSWQKMDSMPFINQDRRGAFVIENIGYVLTSGNAPAIYKYDNISDSWTRETDYPGNGFTFTTFVINNEVYVGLGSDYSHLYNEFFKYNPITKEWSECAQFPGYGRFDAISFTNNGKGYVALGYGIYNYYKDVWEYNPETNSWLRKNDFPGGERGMSVSFNIKGKTYLGLGSKGENYQGYSDIWEYQQDSDTWLKKDSYIGNAKWNNIVFTINDKAYIGTGAKSYGGGSSWSIWRSYKDLWEFNPNIE